MARLAFLAAVYGMVRSGCHRAGRIAGRVLNRAFRKFWHPHTFFAIAVWALCILKVHKDGPLFMRALLVVLPEDATVWHTTLTLLLLFYLYRPLVKVINN